MSFRNDGDALLSRNAALEAENDRLRQENEQLKDPESRALVRTTPRSIDIQNRPPWYVRGFQVIVWIATITVAILTGVL